VDPRLQDNVSLLCAGGIIACATETLFGLLADAYSESAVAAVVAIKQRGPDPIALIAPDLASVAHIGELNDQARSLASKHWPGPLTLVLRVRAQLPAPLVRDGTIGVRIPGPSPALELVRAFGAPLTATSCNPSGQPAARTAAEARAYFGDRLLILPEDAPGGAPSTIVDATGPILRVLRPGAIALTP
jgi:tRNA threonylcarbamoyl adenosine modification protein (Sua5/YciO/YrdC/YwlC family)